MKSPAVFGGALRSTANPIINTEASVHSWFSLQTLRAEEEKLEDTLMPVHAKKGK